MRKGVFGGREGIRTLDLSVANAALSQLSYAPTQLVTFGNITRQAKRRQVSWQQLQGSRLSAKLNAASS